MTKPPSSPPLEESDPATALPPREVVGVDDLVRAHVPFSLSKLSQTEKRLDSYTSNSSAFIREFQYITQSYTLTFHDVHMILTICFPRNAGEMGNKQEFMQTRFIKQIEHIQSEQRQNLTWILNGIIIPQVVF